ncbi:rCG30617 [Rattus norvegicus]|uniref:RCG30617 n=1 Tax=Rattus norvegicus TaxID=10116 RepID=A6IS31_RAT|nr:rCG30617 [Rattus norvegicus]
MAQCTCPAFLTLGSIITNNEKKNKTKQKKPEDDVQ